MAENEVDGYNHHVNARRVLIIKEVVNKWERLNLVNYVDIPTSLGEGQPNPWKRFQGELHQRQAGLPIGEQQQTDSPDSSPVDSKHPVHRQVLLPKHAFSGRANRQMRAGRCGPPATCQASGRCVKSTLCIYPTLTRLWHAPGMTEASLSTGILTGTVKQSRPDPVGLTRHTPHSSPLEDFQDIGPRRTPVLVLHQRASPVPLQNTKHTASASHRYHPPSSTPSPHSTPSNTANHGPRPRRIHPPRVHHLGLHHIHARAPGPAPPALLLGRLRPAGMARLPLVGAEPVGAGAGHRAEHGAGAGGVC